MRVVATKEYNNISYPIEGYAIEVFTMDVNCEIKHRIIFWEHAEQKFEVVANYDTRARAEEVYEDFLTAYSRGDLLYRFPEK